MQVQKRVLVSWDTSEIAEFNIQNRLDEWEEYYPELSKKPDYEYVSNDVYTDSDIYDFEWDFVVDTLTETMKGNKYWRASVKNFGWRSLDGQKVFKAENGKELLQEVLPNTDCTFYVHKYGKGFAIQNYHHDSPMGNEWYYILPIKESTYEGSL